MINLKKMEAKNNTNIDYMKFQDKFTKINRTKLIDWIIEVIHTIDI
jgi:hypothetical protein